MNRGLLHLYWGNGKGKTTAAMGLALRALGAGLRVSVVQFLKTGESAELAGLRQLGAAVYADLPGSRFVFQMTPEERAEIRTRQTALLQHALESPCDLLILDEACAAWQLDMVDAELLRHAVLHRPAEQEIVLTGHEPAGWMLEAADYITEMRCCKHPFEQKIPARHGIEF